MNPCELSNKQVYRELCERYPMSVLSQSWWMDATAAAVGKDWDAAVVWLDASKEHVVENVAAALPFHIVEKCGVRMAMMPQLTQTASVWLSKDADEKQTMRLLAQELDLICKRERYGMCALQGAWPEALTEDLRKLGYRISERVTYRIDEPGDEAQIVARFSQNKRRQWKRAQGLHLVEMNASEFYHFHAECLGGRGKKIAYHEALAERLLGAATEKGCAEIRGAANEAGEVLAAVAMVHDKKVAYYLLPTYLETEKKSGAMAWLTTEVIRLAGERGQVFDFEGSMEESIARSYREFGGEKSTYFRAEKYYTWWLKTAMKIYQKTRR